MATTLVIKNADFSTNKIDTVTFGDTPCTGITINDASYSLTAMGATQAIDYTVTPANTTDAIVWASSDTSVCTVENGTITAVGIGSATITATCGDYSATCSVAVSATYRPTWIIGKMLYGASANAGTQNYIQIMTQTASACGVSAAAPADGSHTLYDATTDDHSSDYYTYPIPGNVTSIRVVAAGCYIGMRFADSTDARYNNYCSWISGEGNDASSSAGVSADHTYTIPDGADSFALTVRLISGTTMTESALENIGVAVTFA